MLIDVAADRVVASATGYSDGALLPDGRVVGLRRAGDGPDMLVVLELADDGAFEDRVVSDDPGRGRRALGDLAVIETNTVILSAAEGSSSDADLLVVSLEDGSVRELARLPGPIFDLDVSPGGALVAVSLEPGSAAGAVISIEDGSAAFVPGTAPPNPRFEPDTVAWRSDGASWALVSDGDVLEVTPDARVIRTLIPDITGGSPIAWRPPR